jgi:hypothetical protein
MTKGEAYRAYYLANRERILEANRERGRAYREKRREASEEEQIKRREKDRNSFYERRSKNVKTLLLEKAEEVDDDWSVVYRKLATLNNLGDVSKKQLDFLLSLSASAEPQEKPPANVE